ncbi:MAG: protein-L-isoaspartate(D-aspartate) O-methyltransferase [Bacteroidota bacterium]|nr:protein-L-isoaspartate(D-aspartate) O-methyltransferase [Bacteroidota bacterium]
MKTREKQHKKSQSGDEQWKNKASKMVKNQIKIRGIRDERVLDAMRNTPRHLFVPDAYQDRAYADGPLPIGHGQTISQPYIVALMSSVLELKGTEKVLEIGTGSGYQVAILSQLANEIYSIEIVKSLATKAEKLLHELGYDNVEVKHGNGYKGWPEKAKFDRIIVTAAPDEIPQALLEQLKPGGKMVLPVGKYHQLLKVIEKTEPGKIKENTVTGVRFVPMVHPDEKD